MDRKKYPLIVWLHGMRESGHDNQSNLRWLDQLIVTPPWERRRYPFFVLAVQCPEDDPSWFHTARTTTSEQDVMRGSSDMVDVTFGILNRTIIEYPIDQGRIYLSGVSSGGSGCWEFAIRHPGLFAAVAPVGSGGTNNANLKSLVETPVWAFHSNNDPLTPVQGVRQTVHLLEHMGGTAHLTEIESNQHDCWSKAFNEFGLLDWLLAQSRHAWTVPPPGTPPTSWQIQKALTGWKWWQVLIQMTVTSVLTGCGILLFVRIWAPHARRGEIIRELPSMDALISRT